MDVHVPRAITAGLRARGIEVITAQEDGSATLPDPALLDRAGVLRAVLFIGAVLFSRDDDLLVEAAARQRRGEDFPTVIYAHQLGLGIGECIQDLSLFAEVAQPDEWRQRVVFLPL
jgi:hypothetical protein